MRYRNLPRIVLQEIGKSPLQHSRCGRKESRCMIAQIAPSSPRFHSYQLHFRIRNKRVKDADGVRSSAHARNDGLRQAAFHLQNLPLRLQPSYPMKISYHGRIGMRAQHTPQQIMCRTNIRHPVPHRFVNGIFQCALTGFHANNLRTQKPHSEDI